MSIDYHTAQGDFGSIVHNLQPMVLSNFVMWLDLKVAEFKVYGQMILDGEQDMSNWFLHPSNSGGGGGSSQSIPRRKSDTFGNASIHSKHKRPVTFSTVSHPTKQMKTERITSHRKPNPVSIDLTDTEALSEMSQSDLTQTSNVETFNVLQLKQEPQTIDSSSPKASSSLSKSSFVERSISQNVKNEQLSYSEQSPHLPSSTFSPSSQTASEKSNVSSSLDSIQTVHRNQTLSEIRHVLPLKSEPEDTEFESISKEDISFDNSADQLLDNVTVTSVVPNIAGVGEQEPTDYHSQTIMKNDGTMFVVDSEQQSVERQHASIGQGLGNICTQSRGKDPRHYDKVDMPSYSQKDFRIKQRPGFGAEEMKDYYRVQEGESNLYVCTICEKSFRALSGIKNHVARYPDGSHGYSSVTNSRIQRRPKGLQAKEFCINKKKRFGSEELKKYYRVQEGESYYVCTICNKQFRALSGLKNHVDRHAGTEKYRCLICEKSFVQLHHFKGHMAGHDPSKMVHCKFCQKQFAYKTSCQRHEKICKGFQ
ncbi:hypothetical protein ScPMuIL_004635 [Solemya velum]